MKAEIIVKRLKDRICPQCDGVMIVTKHQLIKNKRVYRCPKCGYRTIRRQKWRKHNLGDNL